MIRVRMETSFLIQGIRTHVRSLGRSRRGLKLDLWNSNLALLKTSNLLWMPLNCDRYRTIHPCVLLQLVTKKLGHRTQKLFWQIYVKFYQPAGYEPRLRYQSYQILKADSRRADVSELGICIEAAN
jgi:hypothetical protein